jgi:hypothetical protein
MYFETNELPDFSKLRQDQNEQRIIPLGTLVEVDAPWHTQHGVRAFVVDQNLFKGEMMYGISLVGMEILNSIKFYNENAYRYCISFGWYERNLKVIREAE